MKIYWGNKLNMREMLSSNRHY